MDQERQINELRMELSRWAVMPMVNLPGLLTDVPLGEFSWTLSETARSFSEGMGWDHLSSIVFLLTGINIATLGLFTVSVKPGWQEPLNLFTIGVSPSGTRKSGAIKLIRQPIEDWLESIRQEYDQLADLKRVTGLEQSRAVKKMLRDGINSSIRDQVKSGDFNYESIMDSVEKEASCAYD